jgi:GntR family transcriptional regulator / MocR family aminotransferase
VMTDFIMDGHLTSHVRRMRALYGERRQILIDAITARFGNELPVIGDEAGLHLVLCLPDHADDRAVTVAAFDAGVIVRPLAAYYSSATPARRGLLLGYACVANEKIGPAFDTLARVIERTALKAPTRAA